MDMSLSTGVLGMSSASMDMGIGIRDLSSTSMDPDAKDVGSVLMDLGVGVKTRVLAPGF